MSRALLVAPLLLLATVVALAEDAPEKKRTGSTTEAQDKVQDKEQEKEQDKVKEDPNLGMSILGNQEAPKSLVIVPWKSSEIGKSIGISTMLDDSRRPIDKEVFMRVLSYYELRSQTTRQDGAPAGSGAAQPAAAPHRRKP
jgi:hypothetical protein